MRIMPVQRSLDYFVKEDAPQRYLAHRGEGREEDQRCEQPHDPGDAPHGSQQCQPRADLAAEAPGVEAGAAVFDALEDGAGASMRVSLQGYTAADLASLAMSLWNGD